MNLPNDVAIPSWARWLAQDADGSWWAYECEPNEGDHGWYENEVGRCARVASRAPPRQWQHTLRKR